MTIEPGVIVMFRANPIQWETYSILVDGILTANGDPDNPIIFTAENNDDHWGSIQFTNTSVDWDETTLSGSILNNCILEYGGGGMVGAIISCVSSSPMIKNNIIRYSNHDGIYGESDGSPKVISNYIYKNNSRGILLISSGGTLKIILLLIMDRGLYQSILEIYQNSQQYYL